MKRSALVLLCLCLLVVSPAPARAQTIDEARRLAGLCEVWGLLKYFHPSVVAIAPSDWDNVFIDAVPRFKAATSSRSFNQEVANLLGVAGLSYVFRELRVGIPRTAAPLGPALKWIDDATLFQPETRLLLKAIALARTDVTRPFAKSVAGTTNPDFSGDTTYYTSGPAFPDERVRLLALARFWNMVLYYAPNRDLMDHDWVGRLPELVPSFTRAATAMEYGLAVAEMTASINDAHAFTGSAALTAYWGINAAPVEFRLVEGRSIITRVVTQMLPAGLDVRVGDVVTQIDGVPAETRRASLRRYVNGSNEASLERNIHDLMRRTNGTRMVLTVERAGALVNLEFDCPTYSAVTTALSDTSSQSTWSILPGNIGCLNMGKLQVADVPAVMEQLKTSRGMVIDIRNYPNGALYDVGVYLTRELRNFVRFSFPDYSHPGTFIFGKNYSVGPGTPNAWGALPTPSFTYAGKVVVLVNQETQSHAEYTAMAFQAVPGVVVMGSQTAGADGNVSLIKLPGGAYTYFSGLGVFYPDGRCAQRAGITVNIEVKPTIRGIQDGRDEVLEAAIQFLR